MNKKTITLDRQSHGILRAQNNASEYIRRTVITRSTMWRASLATLKQNHWRAPEIRLAVALLEKQDPALLDPTEIVLLIGNPKDTVLAEHKVRALHWSTRLLDLNRSPVLQTALHDILIEHRTGNSELIELLSKY